MRLLRLAHFIWDHSVLVLCFSSLCLRVQVLAARAHPIQEVYQATSNWTMPELRAGETQLEQSDREIASWRLNHAGHWQEQTEPPLSVVYLKTKVGGKSADMKPVRLRLILVSAADVRGAESWLGPLKTCRDSGQIYPWTQRPGLLAERRSQQKKKGQIYPWMLRQNTESLLLWAYATDGDSRPFLWLGPKSAEDAQNMTLRHWLLNKEVPTFPCQVFISLMHGESARVWRYRPSYH